jgi:hypothetical protein
MIRNQNTESHEGEIDICINGCSQFSLNCLLEKNKINSTFRILFKWIGKEQSTLTGSEFNEKSEWK